MNNQDQRCRLVVGAAIGWVPSGGTPLKQRRRELQTLIEDSCLTRSFIFQPGGERWHAGKFPNPTDKPLLNNW